MQQKMHHSQRANSGRDIIQHNAGAFRKGLQLPNRGGLMISKARKSIKPASRLFHESGTAISAVSCPATSSITTKLGIFQH